MPPNVYYVIIYVQNSNTADGDSVESDGGAVGDRYFVIFGESAVKGSAISGRVIAKECGKVDRLGADGCNSQKT